MWFLRNVPKIAGGKKLNAALIPASKEKLFAIGAEDRGELSARFLGQIFEGLPERWNDHCFRQPARLRAGLVGFIGGGRSQIFHAAPIVGQRLLRWSLLWRSDSKQLKRSLG